MLKVILWVLAIAAFGYLKRHGFRRAWYVLRTGDEHPDFHALGAEYFLGSKARKKAKDKQESVPDVQK
jgi:hypothetical protein